MKNPNHTSMELVSERELLITRTFRARASIVFDAWTKPEHLRRWWAPASRGVVLIECEADLRPGGTYRYVLARGESERYVFHGEYIEIVRPTRLVYTQLFEPFSDPVIVTVRFEEHEGTTELVSHEVYPSKEIREMALASGMEDGMRETFEQLDALVAALVA